VAKGRSNRTKKSSLRFIIISFQNKAYYSMLLGEATSLISFSFVQKRLFLDTATFTAGNSKFMTFPFVSSSPRTQEKGAMRFCKRLTTRLPREPFGAPARDR
jgi:hypothetical protein